MLHVVQIVIHLHTYLKYTSILSNRLISSISNLVFTLPNLYVHNFTNHLLLGLCLLNKKLKWSKLKRLIKWMNFIREGVKKIMTVVFFSLAISMRWSSPHKNCNKMPHSVGFSNSATQPSMYLWFIGARMFLFCGTVYINTNVNSDIWYQYEL